MFQCIHPTIDRWRRDSRQWGRMFLFGWLLKHLTRTMKNWSMVTRMPHALFSPRKSDDWICHNNFSTFCLIKGFKAKLINDPVLVIALFLERLSIDWSYPPNHTDNRTPSRGWPTSTLFKWLIVPCSIFLKKFSWHCLVWCYSNECLPLTSWASVTIWSWCILVWVEEKLYLYFQQ